MIGPDDDMPLLYHRMAEAFKWGYGYRSHLGDPIDPEYHDNITKVKLVSIFVTLLQTLFNVEHFNNTNDISKMFSLNCFT